MKTMITLLGVWLLSFPVLLFGQDLHHITIENLLAGGLKDSLNADQQKKVESLTLSGSMNKDDFYFIRDYLKDLKELDMEKVGVDTIPEKAFSGKIQRDWNTGRYSTGFFKVVFPELLTYIGDSAFLGSTEYGCQYIITGRFPYMCDKIFGLLEYDDFYGLNYFLIPSDDNPYCKVLDGGIYSTDGKVIYYGIYPYKILEGTKEIAFRAFCERRIDNVYIPASVKKIGDKAFANIEHPLVPVGSNETRMTYIPPSLVCYCSDLPELGKDVFIHEGIINWYFDLYVPDESVEKYKSSSQWNEFKSIYRLSQFEPYLLGIKNTKEKSFCIHYYSDRLEIESSHVIDKIEILNMNGQIIYQKKVLDMKGNIFLKDIELSVIGVLKVTYVSGKEECVKIKSK